MRSNAIKRTCTLLTLALSASLFLMPTTAVAAQTLELIAAESFEYSGNIVGKNGGTGFTSAWNGYNAYDYGVESPGLSYSGLTTSGGNIYGCTATPNQYCAVTRQVETITSGVIYFQFLANFGAQYGSGTPNIRLKDSAGNILGGIGSNGGTYGAKVSIMDNNLSPKSDGTSSAGTLNSLNFIIVKIDYSANKTSMWLNPNLSTFSYITPPAEDAVFTGLSPQIRTIEIISRTWARATFDEIKIYKLTGTSSAEDQNAMLEAKRIADEARAAQIKASREKINSALVNQQIITAKDLVEADLPIKSVDSLMAAYKELISIKYSLSQPLSAEAQTELKFNKFMKYAMIERITGINTGSVYGRDLVKFGLIDVSMPMKQLATYRLMKKPQTDRDSIEEIEWYFAQSSKFFTERKARIAALFKKK